MISCEYVNPTPWNTPRECSEEKLKEKLENEFNKVSNYERTVCNFHCPPFDTHLDIAPKLDENLRPIVRFGSPVRVHVGSTAVRKSIEEYQPFLCLHGHIHESDGYQYIRKTLCLNPGSDYLSGILCGYVLDLIAEGKKVKFWRIEV
jgi:Icc-related predicted phosphoesterase